MTRPNIGSHRGRPDASGAPGRDQDLSRGFAGRGMGPGQGLKQKAIATIKEAIVHELKAIKQLQEKTDNIDLKNAKNALEAQPKTMKTAEKALQQDSPEGKKYAKVLAAHKKVVAKLPTDPKALDPKSVAKANSELNELKKQLTEFQALL